MTTPDADCEPERSSGVSERKARANAENAKRSTGPRTAEGKATSRMNAFRSGLWAILPDPIVHGDLAEDPAEVQAFITATAQAFEPRDIAEEMQATRIATCYLKMRRASAMEGHLLSGPLMNHDGRPVDMTRPLLERDIDALEEFIEWQMGNRAVEEVDFVGVYFMLCTHLQLGDGGPVLEPVSPASGPSGPSWAQDAVQRILDTELDGYALVWAYGQVQDLREAMERVTALRADHARQRLHDYEGVTRIDQRIGREFQRALADYQKLRQRHLDAA